MRLASEDVALDPAPVFDGRIAYDARRACDSARRNRATDLHQRVRPPVSARLQIAPVSRRSHGSASRRTHRTTCCKTGAGPARLMHDLVVRMMLPAVFM